MAQDRSDLPQGTDKVIAGASSSASPNSPPGGNRGGSTGGSISGTGAAGIETGGSDVLVDTGAATAPEALGGAGTPAGRASQPAETSGGGLVEDDGGDSSLADKLRTGGEKLTGQAADKARDLVSQGLERSAEALSSVSRMVGGTAEGIDERLGQEYGDYARRAAAAIENTANSIASKDPEELIEDSRNFVRRSPGVAIAGAAIVGFALARLVKSTMSSNDDRNGGDGRRDGNSRS
ncbi:MAG TPA: hypothetical protein VM346_08295 [Sphingomicrobium sp.]|nr:hypothetical protein [Sphingomicrobium sp.]